MRKNYNLRKDHKYILKAFLESRIPAISYEYLKYMDYQEAMDSICRALLWNRVFENPQQYFLDAEDKKRFSAAMNDRKKYYPHQREEIIRFYRLAVLTEGVIELYCGK